MARGGQSSAQTPQVFISTREFALFPAQPEFFERGRLEVSMSAPFSPSVVVSIVESSKLAPRA